MTESEVAQLKRDTAQMALNYATAGRQYDKLYDYLRKVEVALERLEYLDDLDKENDDLRERLATCNDDYEEIAAELKKLKKRDGIQAG